MFADAAAAAAAVAASSSRRHWLAAGRRCRNWYDNASAWRSRAMLLLVCVLCASVRVCRFAVISCHSHAKHARANPRKKRRTSATTTPHRCCVTLRCGCDVVVALLSLRLCSAPVCVYVCIVNCAHPKQHTETSANMPCATCSGHAVAHVYRSMNAPRHTNCMVVDRGGVSGFRGVLCVCVCVWRVVGRCAVPADVVK